MRQRFGWLVVVGFALAGALGACSTSNDAGPGPMAGAAGQGQAGSGGEAGGEAGAAGQGHAGAAGESSDTCVTVQPGKLERDGSNFLFATYSPGTGALDADFLSIEFWEWDEAQAPGTFDLGQGSDANYQTCHRCVSAYEDASSDGSTGRVYFQQSGTMTLTTMASPPNPRSAGSLSKVKLVEVTIDPDTLESTPVQGGKCLWIESASWDNTQLMDSECAADPACEICCADFHPSGQAVREDAMRSCLCQEALCKDVCEQSYCRGEAPQLDDPCDSCLVEATGIGGECEQAAEQACGADSDCAALRACELSCTK